MKSYRITFDITTSTDPNEWDWSALLDCAEENQTYEVLFIKEREKVNHHNKYLTISDEIVAARQDSENPQAVDYVTETLANFFQENDGDNFDRVQFLLDCEYEYEPS